MISHGNSMFKRSDGGIFEYIPQDKTELWRVFGRNEKAGREVFSLYNAGGINYPIPNQKKWNPAEAAKSLRPVKSSPQKTKIYYPPVQTKNRPPPKVHPIDLIKRRKPQTLIQQEIDQYYRKPELPPKKGVNREEAIAALQNKFDKESGALPKKTQLPPIKNFRLDPAQEVEIKERALQKIPQSKLMFVEKGIPEGVIVPETKKTKEEIDKELNEMYDAVEQEIMDRQKFLREIDHLDEPQLKEKIKREIIDRVGELEKIIRMLKGK